MHRARAPGCVSTIPAIGDTDIGGLESAARDRDATQRFPGGDGLRAIAALSVLLFHAATISGNTRVGPGRDYFLHLDVGVAVFFVLSGFLLYRPFVLAHLGAAPDPSVWRYLRRRALRIFPAYWLALTVTAFVIHDARIANVFDGIVFYGLLQIYSGRHAFGGLVQAWSLCTELSFYVFLPVYASAVGRLAAGRRALAVERLGLVGLYAVSVVFRLYLLESDAHIGYAWLPAYLDMFALGMGLAVASVTAEVHPGRRPGVIARTLGGPPALLWGAAAILFWTLAQLHLPQGFDPITTAQYMERQLLAGLIALLLVSPAVFEPHGGGSVRRLLRSRPLTVLGAISYGIFLWHLTWLDEASRAAATAAHPATLRDILPIALVATIATAAASYVALERPLLRRR